MAREKDIQSRIQHKHDIEANWNKALNFIPKIGEIIIYDSDEKYGYPRLKIGDGIKDVNSLEFILNTQHILHKTDILSELLEQYMLAIDYDTVLAFDTSEIIFDTNISSASSILGQAILGQMILA